MFPLRYNSPKTSKRLDCKYHHPKYAKLDKILSKWQPLNDSIDVTDGEHGERMYVDNGILFLRITNIKEEGFDLETVKYISSIDHYGRLKRARLLPQNVVMTTTGTVGVSQIIPRDFPEANISADVVKITVKDQNKILPKYLSLFLNSELGRSQTWRLSTGGSRDRIIQKEVYNIRMKVPSLEFQTKIVQSTNTVLNKATQKLNEYKQTVTNISSILAEKLQLNTSKMLSQTFIVKEVDLSKRMDCFSNSPDYKRLLRNLTESKKKGNFDIVLGKDLNLPEVKIGRMEFEKIKLSTYRYIDIGCTNKDFGDVLDYEENILLNLPSRARQKIQTNDVLLPRPIGSTDGVVIVPEQYDGQICSTGFIVIRPKDRKEALLLWAILKSEIVQRQFFFLQSGSIQPEIAPTNFRKHVRIPIPQNSVQDEIIEETSERIKKAKQTLQEYKEMRKFARDTFEKMVLNAHATSERSKNSSKP